MALTMAIREQMGKLCSIHSNGIIAELGHFSL